MDVLKKLQKPNRVIISRTLILLVVCGILAFIVLISRLYKVMITDHDRYESAAVEQQVRETTVTASRGTIYDSKMKILAQSATVETVYISPVEMQKYGEDKSMIASRLSEILAEQGVTYDGIMKKWEDTGSWYKTVAVKIEQEVADKVRAFKNEHDLKSVHIVEDTKRYYPYSSLASQIIGFTGTDNYGLEGLEAIYNKYLQGVNGRIVRATTSEGTDMLFTGFEDYYDAKDGNSLVLTIDSTVQYYLEKYLSQAIEDNDIKNGAMGIAMNVKTGAILGMCTLPDYDLNNYSELNASALAKLTELNLTGEDYNKAYSDALREQWRSRATMDTYEPGSTFKIITLASALEEGIISDNDSFFCGGSIEVPGRDNPLHCWKRTGHGAQTLAQAAQHSCNVAFVTIGMRLGAPKFYDYIEAFGLFNKTGIDIGEGSSLWWDEDIFEDPKNLSQLASASFGQTFNITPIQLITAVSAVANGGYLMNPYIVRQVIDSEGNVVDNVEPTVVRQVISEETSRHVCDILESVVGAKEGTGKNAYVAGYRVAGKTGTSEKVGQASDEYMVSFIGFAPANDPEIAVLVIMDSPSKESGIYISGGVMAAPVVGNIFADVLPYLGIEKAYTEEEEVTNSVVPSVRGLSVAEATKKLKDLGFNVSVRGDEETVTDQAPTANVRLAVGSTVIIYAGESKPANTVLVPDILGKTYKAAKVYLEVNGLFISTTGVEPSYSDTVVVQRQGVESGVEVAYGTVIEVSLVDNDTSIMETTG
jgi:stage V sporulation protein D (sporulation-specific penicillin-binding protein)